eukprot:COSAG01_NODE_1774_length_9262_cov_24.308305_3_plen_82_part_00
MKCLLSNLRRHQFKPWPVGPAAARAAAPKPAGRPNVEILQAISYGEILGSRGSVILGSLLGSLGSHTIPWYVIMRRSTVNL